MTNEKKKDRSLDQLFPSMLKRHRELAYLDKNVPALLAEMNGENPTVARVAEEQLYDFRNDLFDQEDDCYLFVAEAIMEPGTFLDPDQILETELFTEKQKSVFWALQEFYYCYTLGKHLDQILEDGYDDTEDESFKSSEEEESEFQESSEEDQDLVIQEASAILLALLSVKKENGRLSDSAQELANNIIRKFNLDVNPIFPDERRH